MTVTGGAQHLHNLLSELSDHEIIKFVDGTYLLRVSIEDVEKAFLAQ
jgi:hypothetical protein